MAAKNNLAFLSIFAGLFACKAYFLSQNGQEVTVTGMVSKVNNNAVSQLEGLDNGHNNSVLWWKRKEKEKHEASWNNSATCQVQAIIMSGQGSQQKRTKEYLEKPMNGKHMGGSGQPKLSI